MKKTSFSNYLLLIIITVAATIRFWDFSSMQFMHDELSAVIRSQASGLAGVIYKTKTTDVHPFGVPVFVHYWTKIFGTGEMIVKLPFILFGLLSIFYSYKIAEKWFNPTVGIIVCAFLATLQFPTMYGQLERPYATGMLLSVLMAWCWTQFFFADKNKNKYAIGFVLFASLCTYNHYFSLLFAAMVGATGFFFLNKENYKKYLLMCLAVLLLFVPHVSTLLFHLSIGSGGEDSWLGRPRPDWLMTFLKYLFHYSVIIYALAGTLILAGFYFRNREKKPFDKMRIIALVWGILVPCLAYVYSITKTPVLQFSTFTFGLPFLLMFLFSFFSEQKAIVKGAMAAVIMALCTYTLFTERKHFPLFYKHPYEEMARVSVEVIDKKGEKNVSIAHFAMEGFVDFYFQKYNKAFKYFWVKDYDIQGFIKYLDNEKTDYFVAGNLPLEYLSLIRDRYPYLVKKEEGFTFSVYCFTKQKPEQEPKETVLFSEDQNGMLDSGESSPHWQEVRKIVEEATNPGVLYMWLDSTIEYSPGFSSRLKEVVRSRHSILNVSADISTGKEASNPTLVISIEDWGKALLWRGSELVEFKTKGDGFNTIHVSHLFSGMNLESYPDAKISIYVWNRDKKEALVRNLKIEVIESNPMIYGLYEPIE